MTHGSSRFALSRLSFAAGQSLFAAVCVPLLLSINVAHADQPVVTSASDVPAPNTPVDAVATAPAMAPTSAVVGKAKPRWAPAELDFTSASVFVDQDWLFDFANTDRNYTMGFGLRASGAFVEKLALSKPLEGIDWLLRTSEIHDAMAFASGSLEYSRGHSLSLLGSGFTPDNLVLTEPDRTDRPYASIVLLETARTTIDTHGRQLFRTAFGVGLLGTPVGRIVQSYIHEQGLKSNPNYRPIPLGWHNQISEGGEPTLLYSLVYWRELSGSFLHDLTLQTDGSLGYYTNVSAGLLLRIGWLQSDFWQFSSNPLGVVNQNAGVTNRRRSRAWPEIYGYAAARSRLVLYNALLQGQFRPSAYTLSADQISRVVNEFETGLTVSWCGASATAVIASVRSPEHFAEQIRSHVWGGVYVTYQVPLKNAKGFCGGGR